MAMLAPYLPEAVAPAVTYCGIGEHTGAMARGLLETQDIVYFVTLTTFFLGLTAWRFASQD
jgi:hypothetical protein